MNVGLSQVRHVWFLHGFLSISQSRRSDALFSIRIVDLEGHCPCCLLRKCSQHFVHADIGMLTSQRQACPRDRNRQEDPVLCTYDHIYYLETGLGQAARAPRLWVFSKWRPSSAKTRQSLNTPHQSRRFSASVLNYSQLHSFCRSEPLLEFRSWRGERQKTEDCDTMQTRPYTHLTFSHYSMCKCCARSHPFISV